MFAKTIVLSDAFLDMPMGARCLYMTLGMLADDDGFVNSPRSVMRQCGASEDDFKILIAKKFIIPFESGVIVIKHWRINNYLRNDRYKETVFVEEKEWLELDDTGNYHLKDGAVGIPGIPNNGIPSIDKDSIGKNSIDKVIETTNVVSCTQPETADVPSIPLSNGSEWKPSVSDFEEWTRIYPGVDIANEFNRMRQWCLSNPTKKKTARGIRRFVTGWLDREQNKSGGNGRSSYSGSRNADKINNVGNWGKQFEQQNFN